MSAAEIQDKFRTNAGLALCAADVEALEDAVMTLERQDGLRAFELLARAERRETTAAAR
jgi:hypothetical protein